jgi:hypothetical protein
VKKEDWLFSTRWVHVFEEDTAEDAVYRPEDAKVPLSRRPRERLELRRDGTASLFLPGPDDRLVEKAATWSFRDGEILVRTREGRELTIRERSAKRLLVR